MDGWNTSFLFGRPICRVYVSFREANCNTHHHSAPLLPENTKNGGTHPILGAGDPSFVVEHIHQGEAKTENMFMDGKISSDHWR